MTQKNKTKRESGPRLAIDIRRYAETLLAPNMHHVRGGLSWVVGWDRCLAVVTGARFLFHDCAGRRRASA